MPLSHRPVYERHDYFSCTGINAADRKIFATVYILLFCTMKYRYWYFQYVPVGRGCPVSKKRQKRKRKKKGRGEWWYLVRPYEEKKLNKTALIIPRRWRMEFLLRRNEWNGIKKRKKPILTFSIMHTRFIMDPTSTWCSPLPNINASGITMFRLTKCDNIPVLLETCNGKRAIIYFHR